MVDTVDDNPLRFEFNAKDDPMREIDEMADFEGEFLVFRNYRTALWEFFVRIDCLHESAKPSLRCLRFFLTSRMNRTYSSASASAGSVMSTRNAKFFLKFCQRLSRGLDAAILRSRDAEPDRLDGFKPFQAFKNLLVAFCVLNNKLRFAIYC